MNLFIPAVTVTSRGAQVGTDKLRKYVWSKINPINIQSLLVESGVCLEQKKCSYVPQEGGGVSAVWVQYLIPD